MAEQRKSIVVRLVLSEESWWIYQNLAKIGIPETRIINTCVERTLSDSMIKIHKLFGLTNLADVAHPNNANLDEKETPDKANLVDGETPKLTSTQESTNIKS